VTAPLVRTVKVKGVDYSVKSLATWATDPGGVTTSCSSTTKTQANLRIVSQVTSPLTRGTVDLASLVTPPPGAGFSTGEGRVIVKVVDRDQAAIAGASVTLSGGSSYSDLTNAAGCAVFPFVPAGNYTASASSGTMVGWQGESPVTKATSSTAGISTAMTLEIDRPSTFNINFETKVGSAAVAVAKSQYATVTNANLTAPGAKSIQATPAGSPNTLVTASGLYPFIGTYGIYGGQCLTNDPSKAPTSSLPLLQTFSPTPNQTYSPNPKIRVPSINVRVVNAAANAAVAGATVIVKTADAGCTTTYPSQVSATTTTGGLGSIPEPGYPYGTYKICAQSSATGPHGHADIRTGTSPFYDAKHTTTTAIAETVANRVDDVVSNTSSTGTPTIAASPIYPNTPVLPATVGSIMIRLDRTGPCD
jgi:hypothetical protein